jgi:small subunit ribosomal protein S1
MKDIAALLDASLQNFKEGTIIKGTLVAKRGKEAIVDIGYKSEGVIDLDEFENPEELEAGQEVEVLLERLEDDYGNVVLSRQKAAQKQNWDKIVKTYNEGGTITGRVRKIVKGGLMVNIGVEAFIPASQIDIIPPKNLREFEDQTIECKIVKLNEERKNVVLSRRELIEAERAEKRAKLLGQIDKGSTVKGTVKNLTDFGAFIDLDGLDGLLHITDISWSRVNHPSEVLKIGQELEVMVLDIDREKERVSLGLKQRTANPWESLVDKYPLNGKVRGKITNLVPYGAFVELEPGIEGLIHVSEISWTKRIARPSDVLTIGQEVEALVTDINKDEQKLSLSLRQLEANPWDSIGEKYPEKSTVKGIVRNLTAYGAFVELEEGIDGMIHVSDLSWTRKVNQRISLGLKQLEDDPWSAIESRYKVGQVVSGKVSKIASFGAFIDLGDDIDGLVHISQISEDRVNKVKDVLKIGDDVTARVIKVDKTERRIGLSIKAADYSEEQLAKETASYESLRSGDQLGSLGDAFSKAEEEFRPGEGKK